MKKIEIGRQQVKDGNVYPLDRNFAEDLKREMLSLFPETGKRVEETEVRQLSHKGYTTIL